MKNKEELRILAKAIKNIDFNDHGTGMAPDIMRSFEWLGSHNRTPYMPIFIARYVAAANPTRIIELLDEVENLKNEFRSAKNAGCDATCLNYRDDDFELTTLRAQLEIVMEAGHRLARTMDNFDHHPLAKEALVEYRIKIKALDMHE